MRYVRGDEKSDVVARMRLNHLASGYCAVNPLQLAVWSLYHRRCRLHRLTVPHFTAEESQERERSESKPR